jgi:hypothetical protein
VKLIKARGAQYCAAADTEEKITSVVVSEQEEAEAQQHLDHEQLRAEAERLRI